MQALIRRKLVNRINRKKSLMLNDKARKSSDDKKQAVRIIFAGLKNPS